MSLLATKSVSTVVSSFSLRSLSGPNIWSKHSVLEAVLDLDESAFDDWHLADALFDSQGLPGIVDALGAGPSLHAADWLAEATVRLQTAVDCQVSFADWRLSGPPGRVQMAVEYEDELLGRAAFDLARRWLNAVARQEPLDLAVEWSALRGLAQETRLSPSSQPLVAAAAARDIPWLRLDVPQLVQLGQGCTQQRFSHTTGPHTGVIADRITQDVLLTRRMLSDVGIPVPRAQLASSADEACVVANRVGYPVVIKPDGSAYGPGATFRVTTADEVRSAYEFARRYGDRVLVEHHTPGQRYRLLVAGGRIVAGSARDFATETRQPLANIAAVLHPEIETIVLDSARMVGLVLAAVEIVAQDLAMSPQRQNLVVLSVDPALDGDLAADCAAAHASQLGDAIVATLFAPTQTGRLPLVAVLGQPRDTYVAERTASERALRGKNVGLASRDGAWLNGRRLGESRDSVAQHVRQLWRHPRTEQIVVHLTLNDVLREGLPFARCDELVELPSLAQTLDVADPALETDLLRALDCVRQSRVEAR